MTLSLRQKKIVNTKLSLAQAFIQKLKTEKFETISIKDICAKTDVSEAAFFNYFPQKLDVIAFLFKIKIFKTYSTVKSLQQSLPFTECIEKTFELFATEIKHPYMFFEVVSLIGMHKTEMASFTVSSEELLSIHPECAELANTPLVTLPTFFGELIAEAVKKKEIPETINQKVLVEFLMTILNGVPLSIPLTEFPHLTEIYRRHLSVLWKIFQL